VDDEVNTGRSLINAAELLERRGAREVYAAVVHPVLGGMAQNGCATARSANW
jgi:ribose-phosphate pyrophosphokinase